MFSDLPMRAASAAVLLLCGCAAIYAGGLAFLLLCAGLLGLIFVELTKMTLDEHPDWFRWLFGGVCGVSLIVVALGLRNSPLGLLATLGLPLASAMAVRGRRLEFALVGMAAFIAAYEFSLLRLLGTETTWILIWVILIVIATDVAGYVFGRLIGGPSLPEWLSPGKHWSGIAAGWIAALVISYGFVFVVGNSAMWLGVVFSIASQAGDLGMSWVKRRVGVKDCSSLIPGHGGVLDRFDGMAGAGIVLAILHVLGIAGTQSFG